MNKSPSKLIQFILWFSIMDPIFTHLAIGFLIRVILLFYSIIHDAFLTVKYTDIDYFVFSDSAEFVYQGFSPYKRDTYRYTPLLSWILLPNIYIHHTWGKWLFIVCDIVAGCLMYKILSIRNTKRSSLYCVQIWLYNPLTMAVSSRGNAESVMAVLVLASIYCILNKHRFLNVLGYALFGLSVHMKIYPITYALPIYLYLRNKVDNKEKSDIWHVFMKHILPNMEQVKLVTVFLFVFCGTTFLCYHMYGQEFLDETYLYHVTRRDIKHNFSVYFYMMYLTAETGFSDLLGLVVFLPQVVIMLAITIRYKNELPFCCFLNTFVFVTFNKVCTSQYFLWYLCLLPVIMPKLCLTKKESFYWLMFWLFGQMTWLLPAYLLEFEGMSTFIMIWIAGLFLFLNNIIILCCLISKYKLNLQHDMAAISFDLNSVKLLINKLKVS